MFRFLRFIPGSAIWHRTRLRAVMRGYRILKASSRLGVIGEIKNALTEFPINECKGKFNPSILGAAAEFAELALRQYLLMQLGGISLNRVLLMSAANPRRSMVYPMPEHWRRVVRQYGFRVSELRCALYWTAYVFGMLGYGSLRTLRISLDGIRTGHTRKLWGKRCAYFFDLSAGCLPSSHTDGRPSYEIISWYAKWSGRDPAITTIRHGVQGVAHLAVEGMKVESQKMPLPPLAGFREILRFLYWSVGAIVQSACDVLRGRWWHAVMLSHAAVAAQVHQVPKEALARSYLFHNSGWIYRPLWTYEAARKECDINFYFYSTNCEPFKRSADYPPMHYGYQAMNWPRYLVWDEYQADFVRRATKGKGGVEIVGPIWFHDGSDELEPIVENAIAVFDVTPFRNSKYIQMGLGDEYYLPEVTIRFFSDICEATRGLSVSVYWKQKRKIGKSAHPRYRAFTEEFGSTPGVHMIDADISAATLIESCAVTVSLPFTSTALIAREFRRPSIYYDPIGTVQSDDRAAHGIAVISGILPLRDWLRQNLPRR